MTAPLERDEAGPGSPESPESLEGEAARRPRLRLAVMVPVVGTLAIVTLLFVPAGRRLLYRTIYAVGPVKTRLRVMEAVTAELREEATAQGGMVAPERLSLLALAMQRDPSALVRASAAPDPGFPSGVRLRFEIADTGIGEEFQKSDVGNPSVH